jgi:hypothetical protein
MPTNSPLQDDVMTISEVVPDLSTNNFIRKLQRLVKDFPESIPKASQSDKLAVFGGNPQGFDDSAIDADELWEVILNNILKSTLGWGTEGDMDELICRGKRGLNGLVKFVTYFVEKRGVNSVLFEGKLEHLMEAIEKRSVTIGYQEISSILTCPDFPHLTRPIKQCCHRIEQTPKQISLQFCQWQMKTMLSTLMSLSTRGTR